MNGVIMNEWMNEEWTYEKIQEKMSQMKLKVLTKNWMPKIMPNQKKLMPGTMYE